MNLFPYQRQAVDWLLDKERAYLALDMGLGKTAITLTALSELNIQSFLVVCPAIAREHWRAEIRKWLGVRAEIYENYQLSNSRKQFDLEDVAIISYETVSEFMRVFKGVKIRAVIFDEAHYLKTPSAKRTKQALLNKEALAKNALRLIFLSGTPAPNHAGELWPALVAMGATKYSYSQFTEVFCEIDRVFIGHNRWVAKISGTKKKNIPALKKKLEPILYRKTRHEVELDLPEVMFNEYPVEGVKPDVLESNSELKHFPFFQNKNEISLLEVQALAPSISSLRRMHGMRKIKPTIELLENELLSDPDEKFVVFAHHTEILKQLHEHFKESSVLITGETIQIDRVAAIEGFQNNPKKKLFFGSILATGTAINLHAARQVIFVEQDFVPGNNQQALARVVRIGQRSKKVFARWITLSDSFIDRRISEILAKKTLELKELLG